MTLPLLLAKSAISLLKYIAKAMPTKKRVQGSAKPIGSVTYLADLVQKALGMNSFSHHSKRFLLFFLEEFFAARFSGANISIYLIAYPRFPFPGTSSYDTGNFAA